MPLREASRAVHTPAAIDPLPEARDRWSIGGAIRKSIGGSNGPDATRQVRNACSCP